jgi:hypothetical protein
MAQNAAVDRMQCRLFFPIGTTESSELETPAEAPPRPLGKKRAKQQQEVTAKLKCETSGTTGSVLAGI